MRQKLQAVGARELGAVAVFDPVRLEKLGLAAPMAPFHVRGFVRERGRQLGLGAQASEQAARQVDVATRSGAHRDA